MRKKFFFGVVVFFVVVVFFLFAFGVVRASAVKIVPQSMPGVVVGQVKVAMPVMQDEIAVPLKGQSEIGYHVNNTSVVPNDLVINVADVVGGDGVSVLPERIDVLVVDGVVGIRV